MGGHHKQDSASTKGHGVPVFGFHEQALIRCGQANSFAHHTVVQVYVNLTTQGQEGLAVVGVAVAASGLSIGSINPKSARYGEWKFFSMTVNIPLGSEKVGK